MIEHTVTIFLLKKNFFSGSLSKNSDYTIHGSYGKSGNLRNLQHVFKFF